MSVVLPFRSPSQPPTREELLSRLRVLAFDSGNMELDHPHLQLRMAQRNIVMRQILDVVRNGEVIDGPKPDEFGDWRLKLKRVVAGRRVQVVVVVKESRFVVVTAF